MGDRTTVCLSILTEQVDLFKNQLDLHYLAADHITPYENLTEFTYFEVNYADLSFLPSLIELGIAYISRWDAGSEYDAGKEIARFTEDGQVIIKTIHDDDEHISVEQLMGYIRNPERLIECIKEKHQGLQCLPWDNQIEWGQKYKCLQLLTPKI